MSAAPEKPVFDPSQYDHVQDDEVRKTFIQMREAMDKVSKVRQELREKRTEKDEEKPKLKAARDAITSDIDKLQEKIDSYHQKLVPTKEETLARQERSRKYDKRQVLMINRNVLDGKLILGRERVQVHITNAERLNRRLKKLEETPTKEKNINDCKNKIERLTQKIAVADANKDANLKKYISERSQLEKEKEKLEDIAQVTKELESELVLAESHNPAVTQEKLDECNRDLDKLSEELAAWEEANPKKTKDEQDAQDKKKDNIRKEIDAFKVQKKALFEKRDQVGQSPEMQAEMERIVSNKNALEAEIEACEKKIPRTVFSIDENHSMYDIIGPQGATMKEIEGNFGVVIDLRRQEGQVVVRGSDSDACADVLKGLLEHAAANRMEDYVQIDPDLVYEFFGQKGSRIQMIQTTSGTNIDVERETGKLTVKGSAEAIQTAMQMINEFKEASHREVVSYPKALDTVLRPKVAKQWQDDFDVKSIRIKQEECNIVILGKADNAKAAAQEIGDILNNMGDNTIMIPSNVSHYAVIGTRGSRVNEICQITGCFVDVTETKVTILGKKESIEQAKKLVEAIIKDNIREETRISYNTKMHNMLMRQRKIPVVETEEKPAEPEADAEAEETEEKEEKEDDKKDVRPPRTHECLLETLRKKHNCDRLQADLKTKTIFIRGPKDSIPKVTKELREVLEFKGFNRAKLQLDLPVVRWLTVNKQQPGKKGVVTRLDAVRAYEGIEEIVADFRAESKDIEVIGTEEAVEKAKARILQLEGICKAHSMTFEIPANNVGRLLGTRGATRQRIEEEYDVMVHTPARNDNLERDAVVTITVIGRDMDNTEAACKEAIQATEDWGERN